MQIVLDGQVPLETLLPNHPLRAYVRQHRVPERHSATRVKVQHSNIRFCSWQTRREESGGALGSLD